MTADLERIFACLVQGDIRNGLYEDMLNTADCGPFDGCCVAFAYALRAAIGGKVVVLLNEHGQADHAAVYMDGQLVDFDGPLAPRAFMSRYSKNEHVRILGWRPIQSEDLRGACRDSGLVERMSKVLQSICRDGDRHDCSSPAELESPSC